MSLQFYLGRTGTGKTMKIIDEIREELKTNPVGNPIIYIVPEQMSFQAENELLKDHDIKGTVRAQVYSFTRLAWLVLGETGGMSREHINNTGVSMLLRRILDESKNDLLVFKNAANKQGFIDQLNSMLTEYKRYSVDSETMTALSQQTGSPILNEKLKDFAVINNKLEEILEGQYLDSEDYFKLLAEKVKMSEHLKNAKIYIDGFHGFTQLEENIIEQLMLATTDVTVSLTLDKPYKDEIPESYDLFRMTGETYHQIHGLAKANSIKVKPDVILQRNKRSAASESLKYLEENFENRPAPEFKGDSDFQVVEAKNKRVEIEYIAREISKYARGGYRFNDIIVLYRNGEQYADLVRNIFTDYGIPTFIDQKKSMLNHQIIELLNASLDAILSGFSHSSTFRAFKTDFFFDDGDIYKSRDGLAQLENYVLERGIRGSKWQGTWKYKTNIGLEIEEGITQTDLERGMEAEINLQRDKLFSPLFGLHQKLQNSKTVCEYASELFNFIQVLKVDEKLQKLIEQETESGNVQLAKEHEQAWSGLIDLLDQIVNIFGSQEMELQDFVSIVKSGTESLNFSMTPPSIDQVIVGNLELSKPLNAKIVFVIGMNDGVLPMQISEAGVLTESEREKLAEMGVRLASHGATKLFDEEFVAYMALNIASEKTIFTYPIADDEGKSLLPSAYVRRIEDIFPEQKNNRIVVTDEVGTLSEVEQFDFVTNSKAMIKFLTAEIQRAVKGKEEISKIWWTVYKELKNNQHQLSDDAIFALKGLTYSNQSKNLSANNVDALYGKTISGSVSRIEAYNRCPFSYFAKYGLKLNKRAINGIEASDLGSLFHESINLMDKELSKKNISWRLLSNEQCAELAETTVSMLAPRIQHEILFSSSRMKYLMQKYTQLIEKSALAINMQAKNSEFISFGHEVAFGEKGSLIPPLEISLDNYCSMNLRGRIDRVDFLGTEAKNFFSVVDYKSSKKGLDFSEVYDGTSLQMFTYMNVLMKNSSAIFAGASEPAALTYFHLHNPMLSPKGITDENTFENEWLKDYKLTGLVTRDKEVLSKIDSSIETTGGSNIIPVKIKKDGDFDRHSKVASVADFMQISDYVEKVYKRSGNGILTGNTDVKPYKSKNGSSCQFCDYKSICSFDRKVSGNQYRDASKHNLETLIEAIKKQEVGANIE